MEIIEVKKKSYKVVEEVNSYTFLVSDDDKEYLVYNFDQNIDGFKDFKFANKRLKASNVTIPAVYVIDKKNHRFLVEYIKGDTVFDTLTKQDLDEKIIELCFNQNYRARINRMRLDFDPHNFIYQNDKLYYLPFTFTEYRREEDFTQKELRLWFYTNDFKDLLISKGLPIDKNRLKNEYERNKEIVLTVVKYFK